MSSTTIRYQDSEFDANALPIELWLLEVGNQIGVNDESWLNRLKEEWHLQATAGFGFGPSPALDEYVTSDDRRRVLEHFSKWYSPVVACCGKRASVKEDCDAQATVDGFAGTDNGRV